MQIYSRYQPSPGVLHSNSVFRSQTHFFRQKTIDLCSLSMTSSLSRINDPNLVCDLNVLESQKKREEMLRCCDSVCHQHIEMKSPGGQQLQQLDTSLTLRAYKHRLILKSVSYNRLTSCYDNIFSSWTDFVNNNMGQWCWLQRVTRTSRHFMVILSKDHGISIFHRDWLFPFISLLLRWKFTIFVNTDSTKPVKYLFYDCQRKKNQQAHILLSLWCCRFSMYLKYFLYHEISAQNVLLNLH